MHSFKYSNFRRPFSEAYDILPKNEKDVDAIKHLSDNEKSKLKELLAFVKKETGATDPLALSPSTKEKGIKVQRAIAVDLDLKKLSSKYGFKLTSGNGTRGGGGAKSKGFEFEHQIIKDIEKYIAEGETADFKFPDMMKSMHDEFLKDAKTISVKLDGTANTKRPLVFGDVKAVIGGRDLKIGDKVTDVTVTINGTRKIYLSAKFGGTVTFFNAGVRKIMPPSDFADGKINNKDAKKLLDMFGIDEARFIEIFTKYDRANAKKKSQKVIVDATRQANKPALQRLLLTGIGYGYYMVHRKGKKVEFYEMNPARLKKASRISSIKILYPKPGDAKRIDIEVITPLYIFKFNIRNKQGGLHPTHLMCDYKPNPAGASLK